MDQHVPVTYLVKKKLSEFWLVCNLCHILMSILKNVIANSFVPADIRVKEPSLESLCRSVLKLNDCLLNFCDSYVLYCYFTSTNAYTDYDFTALLLEFLQRKKAV